MIIDMHVSPAFIDELHQSETQLQTCRRLTGLYKTDTQPVSFMKTMCKVSDIKMLCLLPLDLTTPHTAYLGTNEQVAQLVQKDSDLFIGFASVDPHRSDAVDVVRHAFLNLHLSGLVLHPSQQRFYPNEELCGALYEVCEEFNKPIIFHAGMSARPNTLSKYAHPLLFEEVACAYPHLRICLSGFAWPWVREVCMLMLKYKNVYTDTALLYFDNPKEFYHQSFCIDIGAHWIDRSLRHQIMFGSDEPRLEQRRMIEAIYNMDWRERTKQMIFRENALDFLNGGGFYD